MARVLAIWLDGFDMDLADRLGLEHLTALAARSAVAGLCNGDDHLTGLTGEHLATGLDAAAAGRASATWFDAATYGCTQEGTRMAPVIGGVPTVVLDACYLDLVAAGAEVQGLTDWGSHDPGAPAACRPSTLSAEVEARFGAYPARPWLYATPWSSPEACAHMGTALTAAVARRSRIARWLLTERLPDWELAFVAVSEAHSGSEGLLHGVDEGSELAAHASAPAARAALVGVYRAIDRLVGDLVHAVPAATVMVFSLHGMGVNDADVPSMALLGELMAREAGHATADGAFPLDAHGVPELAPDASWSAAVVEAVTPPPTDLARRVVRRLPPPMQRAVRTLAASVRPESDAEPAPERPAGHDSLDWMPLMRHQAQWPTMRAFAVPSFYDGRVRVNLRGREARGIVDPADHGTVLDEVEAVLWACREPRTGAPAVTAVRRRPGDPLDLDPTDADLLVTWAPGVLGLRHPTLGTVGPFPPRRTGGHTSPFGRCLVAGPDVVPGPLGEHSSFDVMPTLLALAGITPTRPVSGRALPLARVAAPG